MVFVSWCGWCLLTCLLFCCSGLSITLGTLCFCVLWVLGFVVVVFVLLDVGCVGVCVVAWYFLLVCAW